MSDFHSVVSRDGSIIGYEKIGHGPPMVLVHGGTADRRRWLPAVPQLAQRFTLHIVDRRGRGLSEKEQGPYDIAREGEDVAAVVEAAGRDVYLVGHSYGALCSLEAALRTNAIGRLLIYEPPAATPGHGVTPAPVLERLRAAAGRGDRPLVLETFFREVIHSTPEDIAQMVPTPMWQARLAAALTIVRELEQVERWDISPRLGAIRIPVRLLLGTESSAYYEPAARAIAKEISQADILPLHGQGHMAIDRDTEQFVRAVFAFSAGGPSV
ncbi:alpha/beta hydrolase [Pendulispora brunnea]|uniref:Alpha/beta hydrolase n=1 Tax=Pendulispora brunnea TaxID=2905690 RepID=A0ABZ2JZ58_9BACT